MEYDPKVTIMLQKQLNQLKKMEMNDIKIIINEEDSYDLQADIFGPIDTPFEGGCFRVKLKIPHDFPENAPKGEFITKIFHPNVNQETGEICVNTLKKDWDAQNWSIKNIYEVVRCLLIVPFPESALNQDAAKMFMTSYQEYFNYAKMYTQLHANKHTNILQDKSHHHNQILNHDNNNNHNHNNLANNLNKQISQQNKKWNKRI